ncbi:inactive leucine-rich repeat receptor protein [Salix suchowensis]|nr:inactive leucine-rich repeat receptor protein [Salix suchowensis]
MNSQIQMASLFFIYSFMFSLLATLTVTTATETDISCLKSIKDSVIDPHGYLNSSWNFDNTTEGFICRFTGVECWHPDENRVLNIRLSGKGLKGQFPLGLEHCKSLMSLDFSHNKLQGPIPSSISKRLPYITSLDLSYNNFSGEIPTNISNCSFLNSLKLDHNQLTGNIPPEIGLLERIKFFSVANNHLSGPVPNFTHVNLYDDSFANNAGLCGKPLKKCSSHQRKFDYSFKGGFVIGYLVFSISVAICFTSYCVPWVYAGEGKKKITILGMMMLMRRRKHKITEDGQAGSSLLEEGTKEVSTLEKRVTRMSYADLNDATDSFSENNAIGQGKVGILYKASLPNGYVLAVKKLHAFQFLEEQFISELKILGSLRHINLLPLLGFCIEQNKRFLVYEYMPNGNLYDWLHPKEESQEKVMEWGVRVKIAIGLARGLAWIHQNCHTVRVIHLDISSKCILLDRNFQPKLSNFGEAMLMSSTCTSSVNSELWEMAFVKEDVQGFGVVLLELITRVDPRNMTDSSNNILDEWNDHLLSSSSSSGAIDKSLIGRGFDADIFQLLKVACRCVDPVPDRRPTMLQVYEDIKAIRERCDLADDSENLTRPEICPATSEISVEIERAEYL